MEGNGMKPRIRVNQGAWECAGTGNTGYFQRGLGATRDAAYSDWLGKQVRAQQNAYPQNAYSAASNNACTPRQQFQPFGWTGYFGDAGGY